MLPVLIELEMLPDLISVLDVLKILKSTLPLTMFKLLLPLLESAACVLKDRFVLTVILSNVGLNVFKFLMAKNLKFLVKLNNCFQSYQPSVFKVI